MKVDIATGYLPQIEWRNESIHVQATEWKQGAVTAFVWALESNTAIATIHASTFDEVVSAIKYDVVKKMQSSIDSLLQIEVPPQLSAAQQGHEDRPATLDESRDESK